MRGLPPRALVPEMEPGATSSTKGETVTDKARDACIKQLLDLGFTEEEARQKCSEPRILDKFEQITQAETPGEGED